MEKTQPYLFLIILNLFGWASCIAPFESARMLPKGKTQLQGSYTISYQMNKSSQEFLSEGVGIQAGYGISEKTNVKLRIEAPAYHEGTELVGFISLSGKYSIKKDRLAGYLPVWCFWNHNESHWGVSPGLVACLTPDSRNFDLDLGFETGLPLDRKYQPFLGLNLGIGMSPNVNLWAFRPEFSFRYRPWEGRALLNFGAAIQLKIPFREYTQRKVDLKMLPM